MPYSSAQRSGLRLVRHLPPTRTRNVSWLKLVLTVAACVALFAGTAGLSRSRSAIVETVVLTEGSLETATPITGLVVRQERVYTAPAAGAVARVAAEGQRVRVGTVVARIVAGPAPGKGAAAAAPAPATESQIRQQIDDLAGALYTKAAALSQARARGDGATAGRLQTELDQLAAQQAQLARQLDGTVPTVVPPAPAGPAAGAVQPTGPVAAEIKVDLTGVVTYQTDGLESVLAPDQAAAWKPSVIQGLTPLPRPTAETAAKGDPVLKVIDSFSFSLLAVVPDAVGARLGVGTEVAVRFPGKEGPPVTARIAARVSEGGDTLLRLTASGFPDDLALRRRFEATLVTQQASSGLVVPRTAIDVRDGQQGVWVVDGTNERFHPVRVLGGTDTMVTLETDLHVGVRVRRNAPTWMR